MTPEDYQVYFDEKFVLMPHSYLIAELESECPSGKVDREKYGLPASGFVFVVSILIIKLSQEFFCLDANFKAGAR